jgi:hypothetical protein
MDILSSTKPGSVERGDLQPISDKKTFGCTPPVVVPHRQRHRGGTLRLRHYQGYSLDGYTPRRDCARGRGRLQATRVSLLLRRQRARRCALKIGMGEDRQSLPAVDEPIGMLPPEYSRILAAARFGADKRFTLLLWAGLNPQHAEATNRPSTPIPRGAMRTT